MKKAWILAAVGLLAVVFALGAVACSDDDEDSDASTPEVTETPADTTPAEGTTVTVNLSEYSVTPDPAAAAPGAVTFTANNVGGTEHELVVFKTDLAPDALPTGDDGSVDEAGAGIELIDEVEEIAAGSGGAVSVDLDAGNYVLICNVVEENSDGTTTVHYARGMYAAFTVE